jgi:ADP-ribosyl-[dinitrogen reductase] hydrolase
MDLITNIRSVLFGVATGDALGVPVEFKPRHNLIQNPVREMIGYGTYNLPPGTFSDDSSLTFCLAESIAEGFSIEQTANNFVKWLHEGYWTPYGDVFDVGNASRMAIERIANGTNPLMAGGRDDHSNGNGSLMRILPLIFMLNNKHISDRFELVKDVSSITHAHIRAVIACFIYIEFALCLVKGVDKFDAYESVCAEVSMFLQAKKINQQEIDLFNRILNRNVYELTEDEISGSGYVLHSLEASLWSLLTTENYHDAVLRAVNLGEDTDTTAAVTGGLAGLLYGFDNIPNHWIQKLARNNDIENLAVRLFKQLSRKKNFEDIHS